ncbi:hypothetical protein HK19_13415 [Acetobacter persici]|nr:hypothetical protein HK19_13415 [Acetobacter persici]
MITIRPNIAGFTTKFVCNRLFKRHRIAGGSKCLGDGIGVSAQMPGQRRQAAPFLAERRFDVLHVHS